MRNIIKHRDLILTNCLFSFICWNRLLRTGDYRNCQYFITLSSLKNVYENQSFHSSQNFTKSFIKKSQKQLQSGVHKSFAKLTRERLYLSLFLRELQAYPERGRAFSYKFYKISKNMYCRAFVNGCFWSIRSHAHVREDVILLLQVQLSHIWKYRRSAILSLTPHEIFIDFSQIDSQNAHVQ